MVRTPTKPQTNKISILPLLLWMGFNSSSYCKSILKAGGVVLRFS